MKNIPIPFPPHTHPHPLPHPHLPRPFSLIAQHAALEQRLRLSAGSAAAGCAWISLRPETSPGQGSGLRVGVGAELAGHLCTHCRTLAVVVVVLR